uniref:Uncharacterized protein n=1 Tax=Anguilla anguilla TaxID=7936 RepID=A0A0E9XT41_ANGAN
MRMFQPAMSLKEYQMVCEAIPNSVLPLLKQSHFCDTHASNQSCFICQWCLCYR